MEICYIYSGKGEFYQKRDIHFNFRKGDIFITKAGRGFTIQAACDEKLKFYFLGIDFAEIIRNKANNSLTKEENCILVFKRIYEKCNVSFKDRFNFGLLLQKLYQEIDERKVGYLALAKGYFLECISLLARIICEGKVRQGEASFRRSYKKIERVINFIEKNYSQKLSLQILSNRAHLTPYHFSRIFKEYTTYPPIQYVNIVRIERAKELLSKRKILHHHIAKKIGRFLIFLPKPLRNT